MSTKLTNDEILAILHAEVGDTGNARIDKDGDLHIQKEENSSWMLYGEVDDVAGAAKVLQGFFI